MCPNNGPYTSEKLALEIVHSLSDQESCAATPEISVLFPALAQQDPEVLIGALTILIEEAMEPEPLKAMETLVSLQRALPLIFAKLWESCADHPQAPQNISPLKEALIKTVQTNTPFIVEKLEAGVFVHQLSPFLREWMRALGTDLYDHPSTKAWSLESQKEIWDKMASYVETHKDLPCPAFYFFFMGKHTIPALHPLARSYIEQMGRVKKEDGSDVISQFLYTAMNSYLSASDPKTPYNNLVPLLSPLLELSAGPNIRWWFPEKSALEIFNEVAKTVLAHNPSEAREIMRILERHIEDILVRLPYNLEKPPLAVACDFLETMQEIVTQDTRAFLDRSTERCRLRQEREKHPLRHLFRSFLTNRLKKNSLKKAL